MIIEYHMKVGVLVNYSEVKKYSVQFLVIVSIYFGFIFIILWGRA